jgi:acyl carrier protein phosphodiesterase
MPHLPVEARRWAVRAFISKRVSIDPVSREDFLNFLAHLHLADPDEGLMLGGVVADFVRNPEVAALPANIQAGVRLHRSIDSFTDRHQTVHQSIGRISSRLGWFSGIAIDIYYDHLLARTWENYSAEPLDTFAKRAYRTLELLSAVTPPDARQFLSRFIDQDHINSYATVEGLTYTFTRVSQRIAERIPRKAVWLPDSIPDLIAADRDLVADFQNFYPELMRYAKQMREEICREESK